MKKPGLLIFVVAVVAACAIGFAVIRAIKPAGRIYKGKSVSEWVNLCVEHGGDSFSNDREPGFKEICEIGPDAVPFLTNAIQRKPGFLASTFYKSAYDKMPSRIAKKLPDPIDPSTRPFRAYCVLGALGPAARSAVPFLVTQFSTNYFMLAFVREALIKLGPDAREAVPALRNALHSSDKMLRLTAADVLATVAPETPELLPMVLADMKSADVVARQFATWTLAEIRPRTDTITAALTAALGDPDPAVHSYATDALNPKLPANGQPKPN